MNSWQVERPHVLIADDDLDLQNIASLVFHNAGYEAIAVSNGADALAAFERHSFALVVLDINMPPPNGLQVCAQIRERSNVPVLVLSAGDTEGDLLQALDAGADVYLVKPFSPRALIARVQALLRRAENTEPSHVVTGRFRLESNELLLSFPGGELQLTKLETRLLRLLMAKGGKTVTANELIVEIWDTNSTAHRNMLKQVIFRLRRKLAAEPEALDALRTMANGYMWHDAHASAAQSQTESAG